MPIGPKYFVNKICSLSNMSSATSARLVITRQAELWLQKDGCQLVSQQKIRNNDFKTRSQKMH